MTNEKTNGASPVREPIKYIEWTEIEINGVRVDVPKELAGIILERARKHESSEPVDEP